ncbi:protein root UVB sensitive 3 isoform X2 [Hordeum vulgare subsp. vulgare]|uniref:protein root UVB sensitive 3 isoform X2 n=1 Tax=Hordeum vulgare subsp. vulgare TaxID=112509 RepID=UPI001D1A4EC3|nr:protein root UVB sensitive 3 isoform X2 [Hordeum vulgare subsp. vulgare]
MDVEPSRSAGHGEPGAAAWVTVEEWGGSSGSALSRTAVLTASASSLTSNRFGSRWGRIGSRVLGAFVPEGFPGSVTPDYVPFQMWDTLQGLSTYIRAMLSTQALLGAIGVGEKSATVIGATFQWFLRDLTGMLGGILFAFYQGSNLDSNAKMWRLVADFMNDLGMLMDLLSPLFPSSLIVIMCLGSLSRSFTGVASGATRAALTQHFALANNAADISAKEGSQETLATMSGMGLGMLLAHVTRGHDLVVWVSFLSLTVFHMYVLTPQQVSKQEHILPFWSSWRKLLRVKLPHELVNLGAKASMLTHSDMLLIAKTRSYYTNANYFLLDKDGSVCIFIHKQAVATDVLKSFIHGLVLARLVPKSKSCHMEAHQWMDEKYNTFISKLKVEGYSTERLLSHSIVWKAHWVYGPLDEKTK